MNTAFPSAERLCVLSCVWDTAGHPSSHRAQLLSASEMLGCTWVWEIYQAGDVLLVQRTSILAPEVHEMEDQSLIMACASEKSPPPPPPHVL